MTSTEGVTAESLDEGLDGTPYSIPLDAASRPRVEALVQRLNEVSDRATAARSAAIQSASALLRKNTRVREIYESNKIEGLGPSLLRTGQILESDEARQISAMIQRRSIVGTLTIDPKVADVLGLHGAKLIAETIVSANAGEQRLSETDLRSMHSLIMGAQYGAGRYKQYLNQIKGSSHVPIAPSDVPDAMGRLTDWINALPVRQNFSPIVACAAAHAWLTHVHPFDDGNGRIGRLVANIIGSSAALPTIVVSSTADRGRYLDALGISDVGGDLAALIAVFMRVIDRALRDMEDPAYATRLFELDMEIRSAGYAQQWTAAFVEWLTSFGAEIRVRNLSMEVVASVSPSDFDRWRKQNGAKGVVVGEVEPGSRAAILIVLQRPESLVRYSGNGTPSLKFYRRTFEPWELNPYERARFDPSEVLVLPRGSSEHQTYVYESGRIRHGTHDAPGYVAEAVASAVRARSKGDLD